MGAEGEDQDGGRKRRVQGLDQYVHIHQDDEGEVGHVASCGDQQAMPELGVGVEGVGGTEADDEPPEGVAADAVEGEEGERDIVAGEEDAGAVRTAVGSWRRYGREDYGLMWIGNREGLKWAGRGVSKRKGKRHQSLE